jgi:hypothetical protein
VVYPLAKVRGFFLRACDHDLQRQGDIARQILRLLIINELRMPNKISELVSADQAVFYPDKMCRAISRAPGRWINSKSLCENFNKKSLAVNKKVLSLYRYIINHKTH